MDQQSRQAHTLVLLPRAVYEEEATARRILTGSQMGHNFLALPL